MPTSIQPHGGALVDRVLTGTAREEALAEALAAPRVTLDAIAHSDLELIATGAYSPLTGFLGAGDYWRVVREKRLERGTLWPIPITLAVTPAQAEPLREGWPVALETPDGQIAGLLELHERYTTDVVLEAEAVYGTTDTAHPGVARLHQRGQVLLGGDIWLLNRPASRFPALALTPAETRAAFAARGWRTVVGFQTRNPIHRAHEYIQKAALEIVDGLLLHPLVGATKDDDVPAEARVRSYEVLLRSYYPAGRVLLAAYPAAMRYAGPREAILHAIARQNYGCTHFIVGRDHAGVGSYYGTYDAQHIFDTLLPGDLAITTLRFEHTFYCTACGSVASPRTCPHPGDHHLTLSGTRVRELLRAGTPPPPEFTRPEVAQVLIEALRAA
ncbi:MAG TPA: sulfate adenylyltransferase [Roseiflexaceae bacterium]|nr:sulfate adenylyltransferase [Roseiflexaceae bacterium]